MHYDGFAVFTHDRIQILLTYELLLQILHN